MSFRLTYATMFDPPEAMHQRFDAALDVVRARLGARHALHINGIDAAAAVHATLRSPIDRDVLLGEFAVADAGHAGAAMDAAQAAWARLNEFNPQVAQYLVPNGFNRRVLATFNLREAFAFCQLRAAANAHFSIRRVAQRIYADISRVHPLLTRYLKLHPETWNGIESDYFTTV